MNCLRGYQLLVMAISLNILMLSNGEDSTTDEQELLHEEKIKMKLPEAKEAPGEEAETHNGKLSLEQYYDNLSERYMYGHCRVMPNTADHKSVQASVKGSVDFRQPLQGGPTEIKVSLQGFGIKDDSKKHGFHIHEFGDLSEGCASAGGHFNPFGVVHGSPKDSPEYRHFGDLGNIKEDSKGQVNASTKDYLVSLLGPFSILGRSLVIHAGEDDLGRGNNMESLRTGNAGPRLACCTIGLSEGGRWK